MDFNKYWMWRKFWYFHFVQQKQSKDRSCYKIEKKVKLLFNKYLFVLFKTETFIFTLFQNVAQNFNTTAKPERSWALARSQLVIGKNIRERKSVFYRLIALD